MKYTRLTSKLLVALLAWYVSAASAEQTITFSVPVKLSNLYSDVKTFSVGCNLRNTANPAASYAETVITALFASDIFGAPRPQERDRAGGQAQEARLMVTTDRPVAARDEIIWRGTAYRVQGDPVPQHLGGQVQYRNPLALAGPTG